MEFDKAVADKLQKMLERYAPPASVMPRAENKKLRLFRDETELASSSNLSDEIKRALESSRFLILICSKATKDSKWCRQEIEYFKELHDGSTSNILTLLIEGEPSEVFPEELCFETYSFERPDGSPITETREVEPLATNIVAPTRKESLKKLNQEYLRIVAPLLECRYDDLYNRNQRRRNRRNLLIASSLIIFLALFGIYSSIMMVQINTQRAEAQLNYEEAERQRLLALTNLEEAETQRAEADTQRELAVHNLEEVKYLLLSNAIDYAERLIEQGARTRAGAVLLNVYENIDENHEYADFLYSRFRDVALDTLYNMDESLPFARQELSGEIMQINPVEEHGYAIVTTADVLYQIDLVSGDILQTFPAPEDDQFLITNIYDVYILAITEERNIIVKNTLTLEQEVFDVTVRYYDSDWINFIHYNESISSLTIVNSAWDYFEGGFEHGADTITYIPFEEGERLGKVILTIIPFDFDRMQIDEDEIQRFTFRMDSAHDSLRFSENGRFISIRNQFKNIDSLLMDGYDGEDIIEFGRTVMNNEVTIVEVERFCSSRDKESNLQQMSNVIDIRFNEEEFFRMRHFAITNQGLLKMDGYITTEEDAWYVTSTGDYSIRRMIIYDTIGQEVLFNEQLLTEDSEWGSGFQEVLNQYHHNQEVSTERWLLYVDRQEDNAYLRIFDFNREFGQLIAEHVIPDDFWRYNFFIIQEAEIPYPQVVMVGEQLGRSRVILLSGWRIIGTDAVEKQTLDIAPSSGAITMYPKRLLVGHLNGSLLIYNFGSTLELDNEETEAQVSVDSRGNVIADGEETGITLQRIIDEANINVISYNLNRTKAFGHERVFEPQHHHVFSIWNLETGEVITSFCSDDFISDWEDTGFARPGMRMEINPTFTHASIEITERWTRRYYVVDILTREILYQYLCTPRAYTIFYGIGEDPRIMWRFHVSSLLLEEIDVSDGSIISQRYVSERIGEIVDGRADSYTRAYYNIGDDYIIFIGGTRGAVSHVYSFTSKRAFFLGAFEDVALDASTIYTTSPIRRIVLEPEALFEALRNSPFVGVMTEEDLRATGLYVFDQ